MDGNEWDFWVEMGGGCTLHEELLIVDMEMGKGFQRFFLNLGTDIWFSFYSRFVTMNSCCIVFWWLKLQLCSCKICPFKAQMTSLNYNTGVLVCILQTCFGIQFKPSDMIIVHNIILKLCSLLFPDFRVVTIVTIHCWLLGKTVIDM